ncbi:glycosyltransferase family 2 protein [Flavobacterium aquicola]|uniref:Glycosyl transferase family 2 n=1 Tax=Flavobacterium aquicola TaxID=1682742 RepID=A0A3E0ELR9_9FLAO|nr:glycosyltransferase family 2 protein [Flavobacterium aquicola]REG98269.1 glycosyl transferase family 2 [Flavobacterium aquicola]
MKQFDKLVSVIIPCYNQSEFLDETLNSILIQTYTNWECLIINDGSLDDTEKIAQEWIAKDNRFVYFKKDNEGVSSCRNLGLEKAKGDFIQFLDADDLLAENKLQLSIEAVHEYDVEVVCTNYFLFESHIAKAYPPFSQLGDFEFSFYNLARYWNNGFTIPIHCWVFNKSLLENIQFPLGLTAQEDWVTWLRIFQKSPKTFYIPQQLAFYRINPKGRTQTGGFFNETLEAINFLKSFLNEAEFRILYEAVLTSSNEGNIYWRNREDNLKKSNTYQFGLLVKKIFQKIGLLKLARYLFSFVLKFKSK